MIKTINKACKSLKNGLDLDNKVPFGCNDKVINGILPI